MSAAELLSTGCNLDRKSPHAKQDVMHLLTSRFGRGFTSPNLYRARQLHMAFPMHRILSTPSIESPPGVSPAVSGKLPRGIRQAFLART